MEVKFHPSSSSPLGRGMCSAFHTAALNAGIKFADIHWAGCWAQCRACLVVIVKRKSPYLGQESNCVVQFVVSRQSCQECLIRDSNLAVPIASRQITDPLHRVARSLSLQTGRWGCTDLWGHHHAIMPDSCGDHTVSNPMGIMLSFC